MAELAEQKTPFAPITPEDVTEFFKEKGATHICPICKNGSWHVLSGRDFVGLAQMVLQSDGSHWKSQVNMLSVYCAQCGYFRQHLLQPFYDWLEARKVGGTKK